MFDYKPLPRPSMSSTSHKYLPVLCLFSQVDSRHRKGHRNLESTSIYAFPCEIKSTEGSIDREKKTLLLLHICYTSRPSFSICTKLLFFNNIVSIYCFSKTWAIFFFYLLLHFCSNYVIWIWMPTFVFWLLSFPSSVQTPPELFALCRALKNRNLQNKVINTYNSNADNQTLPIQC